MVIGAVAMNQKNIPDEQRSNETLTDIDTTQKYLVCGKSHNQHHQENETIFCLNISVKGSE